jgi:RNA polymerase sigma-70 factor, ECF subfamily
VDDAEFDAFYAATARRLIGQLFALTGSLAEAEDCVQEAFGQAWTRRRQLDEADDPVAWVRTVAWRLAISRWRRARNAVRAWQAREVIAAPATPGPSPERLVLEDALRRLSRSQRECVVLYHVCDLSVAQISAITGSPAGTVKARLARARVQLAALLADIDGARPEGPVAAGADATKEGWNA